MTETSATTMTTTLPPSRRPGLVGYAASLLLVAAAATAGAYAGRAGLPAFLVGRQHYAESVIAFLPAEHFLGGGADRPAMRSYLEAQVEQARSKRVVDRAATSPRWLAAAGDQSWEAVATAFATGLTVRTDGRTLIRIGFRHPDRAVAGAGAVAVAEAYDQLYKERQAGRFDRALEALDQRRVVLRNELAQRDDRARGIAASHDVADVGAAVAAAAAQLARVEAAMTDARIASAAGPAAGGPDTRRTSGPGSGQPPLAGLEALAAEYQAKLQKLTGAHQELQALERDRAVLAARFRAVDDRQDMLRFERLGVERLEVRSLGDIVVDPDDAETTPTGPARPARAAAAGGARRPCSWWAYERSRGSSAAGGEPGRAGLKKAPAGRSGRRRPGDARRGDEPVGLRDRSGTRKGVIRSEREPQRGRGSGHRNWRGRAARRPAGGVGAERERPHRLSLPDAARQAVVTFAAGTSPHSGHRPGVARRS